MKVVSFFPKRIQIYHSEKQKGRLGSGNNWACGYRNGSLAEESILNSLRWQLEHADRVDTIIPILSLAGGTGKINYVREDASSVCRE